MKRWIAAIIFGTFSRFFGNPQTVYKLEDRLANSGPVRQFARTVVALYQRGLWELKHLKSLPQQQIGGTQKPTIDIPEELMRKLKQFESDIKKRTGGKLN